MYQGYIPGSQGLQGFSFIVVEIRPNLRLRRGGIDYRCAFPSAWYVSWVQVIRVDYIALKNNVYDSCNHGVLEYWINGVMKKSILQYSNTPLLRKLSCTVEVFILLCESIYGSH
jgi:hypothetical protein